MKGECATDTAIWADGVCLRLLFFFPCAGLAHVVLTCKHECASGADLNAVAAVDACRIGEIHIEFGRDSDVEASTCNSNGKCILPLFTTCINTLETLDPSATWWWPVVASSRCVVGSAGLPKRVGSASYSVFQRVTFFVNERSTEEPSNSSTSLRLWSVRSVSVRTTIPGSTLREHEGTNTREPSTSTMHTLQAFFGVMVSPKHKVGISLPIVRHALKIVSSSATVTD